MTDTPGDPFLDADHLARQTFDDRELGRELLLLLEEQCGRLLPVLAGVGARRTRSDAAHTLKGAARAVGAWRLAVAAERLEAALEEGREPVEPLVAALDEVIRDTRRAVRRWLDAAGGRDLSP